MQAVSESERVGPQFAPAGRIDVDAIGRELYRLVEELYPICRSITGNGLRESLRILQRVVPLRLMEVPTGTEVFDWVIPKEWNIRDAYIKDAAGRRIVDFQRSNLHVVNYSIPVRKRMGLAELKPHLFSLPDHPGWIPYRTSYYREDWGFCLRHEDLINLAEDDYEVCVDATLEQGHLTFGEYVVPGESSDEVLLSCHSCHPSLCNDNLSGMTVAALLARHLSAARPRYTHRFLWIPGTIGSIAWLALHEAEAARIRHGLVLTCLGDSGKMTYKRSRRGNGEIDRAVAHVLRHSGQDFETVDFSPYGYDERQYCSPGFNLPVGCLMRTPNGCYPEYHTSADDLTFVHPDKLADSFTKILGVLSLLDGNGVYLNLSPRCEPQLGRRGLYRKAPGGKGDGSDELALLWVLNLSDGENDLLQIADRAGLRFESIRRAADALCQAGLLTRKGAALPA